MDFRGVSSSVLARVIKVLLPMMHNCENRLAEATLVRLQPGDYKAVFIAVIPEQAICQPRERR